MKPRILFKGLFISLPLALAACTDPLAGIERIEDVELASDVATPQAVPDAAELAKEEGGLFSELSTPETADPSDLAPTTDTIAQAPKDDAPGGFLGLLRQLGNSVAAEADVKDAETEVDTAVAGLENASAAPENGAENSTGNVAQIAALDAPSDAAVLPEVVEPQQEAEIQDSAVASLAEENVGAVEAIDEIEKDEDVSEQTLASSVEPVEQPKRRGLLALLGGPKVADQNGTQVENLVKVSADASERSQPLAETAQAEPEVTEPVRTASLSDDILQDAPAPLVEPRKRRGLFSGSASHAKSISTVGPGVSDVSFGTVLPYGSVGRVCGAKAHSLGRKIDKAPARGNGYALYDSNAESVTARTFYVTGFADGCPRQFTAALALFGAPSVHEQLRYGRPSDLYPYSKTDQAYEKVKSSICRVGKRKPCGDKISKVEKNTVFISTYEHFENNARWADILIHDGAVLATALKTP